MWDAYVAGTIPVGAVVVDAAGDVLARLIELAAGLLCRAFLAARRERDKRKHEDECFHACDCRGGHHAP